MGFAALAGKGALIKGAGSLVLLSGSSVGGWYAYDAIVNPAPQEKDLSIKDYFYPNVRNSCFKKSFPGVFLYEGKVEKEETAQANEDSFYNAPAKITKDPKPTTQGCMIMRYYGKTVEKDKRKWAFESETVVINGNSGIAFWAEINGMDSNNQKYQIYLLENKNNRWDINFGFITYEIKSPTEINSPNKKIKLTYDSNSKKWSSTIDGYREYYGKWKKDDNSSGGANTLWNKILKAPNLADIQAKYIYKNNKLHEFKASQPQDVKGKLDKWFENFKDTKGDWDPI